MDVPKEVDELKDDLVWTRYYLNQYKKLFLHNKKRTDLLNITCPWVLSYDSIDVLG
jgi:hypothetical protein